mmetsp:Transcript_14980/g.36229  ORF Transcript_14980/g.36229 Transcript_14980/m.36229 type:complete len:310 (+) Transcript_14980:249-1178(+)
MPAARRCLMVLDAGDCTKPPTLILIQDVVVTHTHAITLRTHTRFHDLRKENKTTSHLPFPVAIMHGSGLSQPLNPIKSHTHTHSTRTRRRLDDGAGGEPGAAEQRNDALADEVAAVRGVQLLHARRVGDDAVRPDEHVAVHHAVLQHAPGPHVRRRRAVQQRHVRLAQQDGALQRAPLAQHHARAHDGVHHRHARPYHHALADDALLREDLPVEARRGQAARDGEDGVGVVDEGRRAGHPRRAAGDGGFQVGVEPLAQGADGLPVPLERVRVHLEPLPQRLRNDVPSEVQRLSLRPLVLAMQQRLHGSR